jgi:uncharacterized membrane protein (DUF4010 family)
MAASPPALLVLASLGGEALGLAVALGIGLLLGVERERRKGEGPGRQAAGIRTFALVALLGGVAMLIGSALVLAVAGLFVGAAAVVSYALGDRRDPGITTEVALVVTFLLGALAQDEPELAAGAGVTVAVLLASRERLHAFVSRTLTEDELHDALLFAAAALVVLPLAPDEAVGPYEVFNPFIVWRLVVMVMAISSAGYITVRLIGPRFGLPVSGFASGFVSSAATVGSMGARAARDPAVVRPAVAGAALSSVATIVQMVAVVGATNPETLRGLVLPLVGAAVVAVGYGAVVAVRMARGTAVDEEATVRPFELKSGLVFAATVVGVLFVSAAINDTLGRAGLALSAGVAGFADAHAAAISVASLVAAGRIDSSDAVIPILAGLSTNTVTKAVLAFALGRTRFGLEVGAGLALMVAALWLGLLASTRL